MLSLSCPSKKHFLYVDKVLSLSLTLKQTFKIAFHIVTWTLELQVYLPTGFLDLNLPKHIPLESPIEFTQYSNNVKYAFYSHPFPGCVLNEQNMS